METQLLKEIIVEQQAALKSLGTGIDRTGLVTIKKYLHLPQVVVIAGIRRAGKSTLMAQIMHTLDEGGYYFNFEDERLIDFQITDFNHLYEALIELYGEKKLFFFDEIQNIPGWERFVRRMYDRGHKFFITGSNASLLSAELGTKLTGRHIAYALFPFSFEEYLVFQGQIIKTVAVLDTKKRALLKKYFLQYLAQGGMPEYVRYQNPEALREVYNNILFRDIIARYGITDTKSLRELSLYLLTNIGAAFSYNNLKNILQLGSVNTVKSYIEYLENSFLFFTVTRFNYSVKKQIVAPKKIYCIDTGMAHTIGFRFSKDQGKLLENIVFLQLKRKGLNIYYYITEDGREIDFLIQHRPKKYSLVQVAWQLTDPATKKREIQNLLIAMDELGLKVASLITFDSSETITIDKKTIRIIPAYQWFLSSD